jgi:hypothetical protein
VSDTGHRIDPRTGRKDHRPAKAGLNWRFVGWEGHCFGQPPALPLPNPDTTPPTIGITSAPPSGLTKTTAVFRFSANEPVSRVECSLDGGGYVRCYTPTRYTGLGTGGHSFCVRAVDRAGNVGAAACVSWTIEAKPQPPPPTTQEQPATQPPDGGSDGGREDDDQGRTNPNCDQPAILDVC